MTVLQFLCQLCSEQARTLPIFFSIFLMMGFAWLMAFISGLFVKEADNE